MSVAAAEAMAAAAEAARACTPTVKPTSPLSLNHSSLNPFPLPPNPSKIETVFREHFSSHFFCGSGCHEIVDEEENGCVTKPTKLVGVQDLLLGVARVDGDAVEGGDEGTRVSVELADK